MTMTSAALPSRLSRDERRARTRRALLDAGAQVFAERGYHSASVDDVAEAAGLTKGAVYSNFESKEDLFLAVLDDRMGPSLHEWEAVFARPGSLEDRLREIAETSGGLLSDSRTWLLLKAEFWLHAMRHPETRFKLAARQRVLREGITRLVERQAADTGVSLPLPAGDVASAILALREGLAVQRLVDPAAVPDELFPEVLTAMLGTLSATAASEGAPRDA